jgi:hypothetical protein
MVETRLLGADEKRYFNYESNRERGRHRLKKERVPEVLRISDREHTNNIEV